jgi:hypothetical protein
VSPPLLYVAVLLALSLISPDFLPGIAVSDDKATILSMGIAAGLGAGIFEELGWMGFAVPRMRLRHGIFATGLIVGCFGQRGTSLRTSGQAALPPARSPWSSSCPRGSSVFLWGN